LIDAYCHVGQPKYGGPEEAIATLERWGVDRAVFVLGPGVPDLEALRRVREVWGDRARTMGIPFGATEAQREELAEVQLALGITGMRLMPFEIEPNPGVLAKLGEAGGGLLAINVYQSAAVMRALLRWLDSYPEGFIAAPHFLQPRDLESGTEDVDLFGKLLAHPRFNAIFSRHGGASGEPYPHEDLRPWVEPILDTLGPDRVLWGSEFPILFQRDEQFDDALGWLEALGIELVESEREAVFGGNARRLFFDRPAPSVESVEPPDWWHEQFRTDGQVAALRQGDIQLPDSTWQTLLSDYLRKCGDRRDLRFTDYLAARLTELAEQQGDPGGDVR
jgi:predicted TIM-barrel fold metal-dependent hydrolase